MVKMDLLELILFILIYFGGIMTIAWFILPWICGTETMYSLLKERFTHARGKGEIIDSIANQTKEIEKLTCQQRELNQKNIELKKKSTYYQAFSDQFGTIHDN